jgi:hypothetical protein
MGRPSASHPPDPFHQTLVLIKSLPPRRFFFVQVYFYSV